jgi:protein TonB
MPALAKSLPFAALNTAERNFRIALIASLVIHAVVLSIHFRLPEAAGRVAERALDVILVNSKGPHKPTEHVQAKAQANLDGGGNTDEDRRATTPLPASLQMQEGDNLKQAQQRVQQLEQQQQELLASMRAQRPVTQAAARKNPEALAAAAAGNDLSNAAIAIARLEAEIARNLDAYNRRPRRKFIGARVEEYKFAQYVEDWRQKVERLGNLNYPEAAKGRYYGDVVLTVVIRADGSVVQVDVDRSSGNKVLDAAARRIIEIGAPYAPFPPAIRAEATELQISRTLSFMRGNQLQSVAGGS